MKKLTDFLDRHPTIGKVSRHAATALTSLALSMLVTIEIIGPAIIESCQAVLVQRLGGL